MNNEREQLNLGLEGVENPAPQFHDPNDEIKRVHSGHRGAIKKSSTGVTENRRYGAPAKSIINKDGGYNPREHSGKVAGSGPDQF